MNALPFVNSKDIREHLEAIGYKFSPTEIAWLIYRSRSCTLAEKHTALRQLAEEYPDAYLVSASADDFREAAHPDEPPEKLSDYIRFYTDTEEKLLREFLKNDGSFVYCIDPLDVGSYLGGYYIDKVFTRAFSDYETCVDAFKKWYRKASAQYEGATDRAKYKIYCRPIDGAPVRHSSVTVRSDGEILSLTDPDGWYGTEDLSPYHEFDFMWFSIPVPFQKGDILWDPAQGDRGFCRGPAVMCDITPEHYARTKRRGYDDSDMNIWGYFQNDDGTVYKDVTSNYMDFEYCPAEMLTGKRRILTALSSLVKGKIDIDLFSSAYIHILAGEVSEAAKPEAFTDEDLRQAGLGEN